ncbi:AfsR/SARP family transcriptional regulator [Acrocarpospora catenulata]|uniref:AfsR/SARP family transcriptional regulator n=1 Tax=Acrocarpospora catenulata TaxID=2836182 RepID=UPI001BD97D0E|nr:AfsR/SARP family transcriptional regulator [Acrocarpospora catenulata]
MRFRVLGTLEVRSDSHRVVRLGAAKQRVLLAVLLLNVNRPVRVDHIVDALWPQRPPRTAAVALRTYVSALRQVLGLAGRVEPPLLSTVPGGYELRLTPADLDLLTFEELAAQGQRALTEGQPVVAAERLRGALGLWRGRPFEDVALDPSLETEVIRLEERKLAAQETWIESQLTLGRHVELLAELGALVAEQPLRERLQAQWMLALYRSGRQAEALRAYQDLRHRLVHELGVEPSPPLRRLHHQILAGHSALAPPSPLPQAVPRELPRDIGSFTGRAAELAFLHDLAGTGDPGGPVIAAIDGMAGVGKTTLAVHAAHQLAERYPDGQLFVDLRGFTRGGSPVDPADALDQMLRSLGVPGERIPHSPDARAALYRTALAGRRMLILLDNVAEEAQLRPLLPGSPHCLILITSRRRLAGLEDVRPLSLDVMPRRDAVTLFTRTAGEQRVSDAPPDLLDEIVELCGRLPLAIRIAAARLRVRPGWTPAHLADRMRDHQNRLGELEVGRLSITAALDLSYQHLTPGQQDMYRLLGLHPGPDIERHAAAALVGTTPDHAGRLLDELVDAHLLQEPTPGRYRFHDLPRAHATATLADEDTDHDRRAALTRLFDHYIQTATRAITTAHTPHQDPAPRTQALDWLNAELVNLLSTAIHATRHNWPTQALALTAPLHYHVRERARTTTTRFHELATLCAQAQTHLTQGRYAPATTYFEQALKLAHPIAPRDS